VGSFRRQAESAEGRKPEMQTTTDIIANIRKSVDFEIIQSVTKHDESWRDKSRPYPVRWFYRLRGTGRKTIEGFLRNQPNNFWEGRRQEKLEQMPRGIRKYDDGVKFIPQKIIDDFVQKQAAFFASHPCALIQLDHRLDKEVDQGWLWIAASVWCGRFPFQYIVPKDAFNHCENFKNVLQNVFQEILHRYSSKLKISEIEVVEMLICVDEGLGDQSFDDDTQVSPAKIAKRLDLSVDLVRKRLERRRKHDHTCFSEVQNRQKNDPQFSYNWGKVKDLFLPQKTSE
jgi:hypothetical protein